MARVIGIGGVFFRSKDPKALQAWYHANLGFPACENDHPSVTFKFDDDLKCGRQGYAVWAPFSADTTYFDPSEKGFMINLRVDDLDGLVADLKTKKIDILDGPVDEAPYGRFAWILDPEGNKVELWEPPAA